MSERRITVEIDGGVADVHLNRGDKMNAMDGRMFAALVETADELACNNAVRAVVLSGNGPSFCAGLDFSGFQAMAGGVGGDESDSTGNIGRVEKEREHVTHHAQQAVWGWHQLPMPVIAAVHGVAFGAGCQLAVGADIRFVTPDVRMSVLEIRWGISPDMTITSLLPSLIGADRTKEMIWTGREVNGPEAVEIGLATHMTDDPLDGAMELAKLIATKSPHAIRAGKRLVNSVAPEDYNAQFERERNEIGSLIGTPNQVESVGAFFEKRPPDYTDPE
ncbi:MAG: crotonase/enoyl-CoA hydratase family protein [Acidimicrobiales bacterium]|nr:crotonase/enoyl-CoA hydratase family protein [Acidimicrobiales bacterium]